MKYAVTVVIVLLACIVGQQAFYRHQDEVRAAKVARNVAEAARQESADQLVRTEASFNAAQAEFLAVEASLKATQEAKAQHASIQASANRLAARQMKDMDEKRDAESRRVAEAIRADVLRKYELQQKCSPFQGKSFDQWPASCSEVSAGLREYLAAR